MYVCPFRSGVVLAYHCSILFTDSNRAAFQQKLHVMTKGRSDIAEVVITLSTS